MLIQQPLKSIADVRHKSHMASTLDSNGQLALMESASAGDAAGNDFGTLADVFAQAGQILVINAVDAINAEAANLFAAAMHRTRRTHSQKVLFPEVVQFPMSEKVIFEKILPEMESMGFELEDLDRKSVV